MEEASGWYVKALTAEPVLDRTNPEELLCDCECGCRVPAMPVFNIPVCLQCALNVHKGAPSRVSS